MQDNSKSVEIILDALVMNWSDFAASDKDATVHNYVWIKCKRFL